MDNNSIKLTQRFKVINFNKILIKRPNQIFANPS